jgi:hypothetical protein
LGFSLLRIKNFTPLLRLYPPRSGVSLRALAPPTHRAGATRRGRCDATGREARKEDLDAERLCMIPRKREEVEVFACLFRGV